MRNQSFLIENAGFEFNIIAVSFSFILITLMSLGYFTTILHIQNILQLHKNAWIQPQKEKNGQSWKTEI